MPRLEDLDARLQEAIATVTGLRPRRVIEHILAHGQVTTEDLLGMGYKHPPRAARDVRECGVPLVTTRVSDSDGKSMAAYTFGDPEDVVGDRLGGRQVLPKELRDRLVTLQGGRCAVCHHAYESRYFQVDHRVPYEVAGDSAPTAEGQHFMALCGACQRKKSWSCEHCQNWVAKSPDVCRTCYWADPHSYAHVAGEDVRQITLTFAGPEALEFDQLRRTLGADAVDAAARRALLSIARPR